MQQTLDVALISATAKSNSLHHKATSFGMFTRAYGLGKGLSGNLYGDKLSAYLAQ